MSAEIVEVSSPAGSLAPGPSDDRMYVIFPEFKPKEYGLHTDEYGRPFVYLPPWNGPIYAPAVPDDERSAHVAHGADCHLCGGQVLKPLTPYA